MYTNRPMSNWPVGTLALGWLYSTGPTWSDTLLAPIATVASQGAFQRSSRSWKVLAPTFLVARVCAGFAAT